MPDTPNPQPPVTDEEKRRVLIAAMPTWTPNETNMFEVAASLQRHACLQAREIERLRDQELRAFHDAQLKADHSLGLARHWLSDAGFPGQAQIEMGVRMALDALREANAEIAALRARVKELEGE